MKDIFIIYLIYRYYRFCFAFLFFIFLGWGYKNLPPINNINDFLIPKWYVFAILFATFQAVSYYIGMWPMVAMLLGLFASFMIEGFDLGFIFGMVVIIMSSVFKFLWGKFLWF